jgi:ankyrin repeat protein
MTGFNIEDTTTIEDIKNYLITNDFTENIIKFLLEKGTTNDLNTIKDNSGKTALIYASRYSNSISTENTVKMLIEAGAELNIQDNDGATALIYASETSNSISTENTVKMLIEAGADLNIKNNNGTTALILASVYSNITSTENTLKMLIDAGANLNLKDNGGRTPLMYASVYSNSTSTENTLKMLIDAGADLNIKDNGGRTPLIYASAYSNSTSTENTLKILIDAGADLNITDNDGRTSLMYASRYSNSFSTENTVKMLVETGADLNIKDNDGNTAYYYLKEMNPTSVLLPLLNPNKILEENGENELLKQRIFANITKTVSFTDPIMLTEEEINIGDYIEGNKDNIVIVYDKNRYFFTTRETIMNQIQDATLFPCKVADTMRPENIVRNKPLYNLKKIGFVNVFPCDMKKFFENLDCQLFAVINTNEKYPSFVSDDVLNRSGSYVSSAHCQAGLESKISYMIAAVPSIKDNPETVQMGGVRTLEDIKKFEKKIKDRKTKNNKSKKNNKDKRTRKSKKKNKSKRTRKSKKKNKSKITRESKKKE